MHHLKRSIIVVIVFLFINKELPKAIMHRSKLRKTFLRNRLNENRKKYSKQWNCCISLLRGIKKIATTILRNNNEKNITDNKKFWKTVTSFL